MVEPDSIGTVTSWQNDRLIDLIAKDGLRGHLPSKMGRLHLSYLLPINCISLSCSPIPLTDSHLPAYSTSAGTRDCLVSAFVVHAATEILPEFAVSACTGIDLFSKGIRELSLVCFLLDHLQQVVDHLALTSEFRRQIGIASRLEMEYLVTWVVQGPVLVEPDSDLAICI